MSELTVTHANRMEIPEGFTEKLNQFGKESGHTWSEVLTEAGELHNSELLTMATAFIFPFTRILKAVVESGEEFDAEMFDTMLFGMGLSYTMGQGKWDDRMPVFVPDTDAHLMDYDRVVTRSGKEYRPIELMSKISDIVKAIDPQEVMDKAYPKAAFKKRATDLPKQPHHLLKALAILFHTIDEKL